MFLDPATGQPSYCQVPDRLHVDFGLSSTALNWIASYLTERKQYVKVGQHSPRLTTCSSGVPQGSVLGPVLFAAYLSPVGDPIESYGVRYQQYADDFHAAVLVDAR